MNIPNFTINVKVDLGVTPELVAMVTQIIAARKQRDVAPVQATFVSEEQAPEPERKPRGRKKQTEAAEQAPAADQPEATEEQQEQAPHAEAAPAAESQQPEPKEYTEEDIRAAMHKTRQRIEGEDYKEHPESDGYTRYHRALTAQFKNIAATYGAEKPSALKPEMRAAFIKDCEYLAVDPETDTVCSTEKAPF